MYLYILHLYAFHTLLMFRPNGPLGMADGKSCIVCIRGSGERCLLLVVIVICMKGLSCSSVETMLVAVTCT